MPGAKHKNAAVVDVYAEFVRTEVAREVIRNETALLQVLENLSTVRGHVLDHLERVYIAAHKDSMLLQQDLEAMKRLCEMLNVLSGRSAIRADDRDCFDCGKGPCTMNCGPSR